MTVTSPPPLDPDRLADAGSPAESLARKWDALLRAAGVVAMLAGVPQDSITADRRDFPRILPALEGWRLNLAAQGVDDIAAVMEPGLAALLAIHRRGADPTAAAQALWDEFAGSRDALMALAPKPR